MKSIVFKRNVTGLPHLLKFLHIRMIKTEDASIMTAVVFARNIRIPVIFPLELSYYECFNVKIFFLYLLSISFYYSLNMWHNLL